MLKHSMTIAHVEESHRVSKYAPISKHLPPKATGHTRSSEAITAKHLSVLNLERVCYKFNFSFVRE